MGIKGRENGMENGEAAENGAVIKSECTCGGISGAAEFNAEVNVPCNTALRAIVLTGGECSLEASAVRDIIDGFRKSGRLLVIAADSGYLKAEPLGLNVDILVGDFDSLPKEYLPDAFTHDMEVIQSPCEKDETDTMLACNIAVERGCGEVAIIGGFGGRCDHELSNVFWLENMLDRGISASMTSGRDYIRIISDESVTVKSGCSYFSVFALSECTVSISGCKYPLNNARLVRSVPYAVSNEVCGESAVVTVCGKALLCIVS